MAPTGHGRMLLRVYLGLIAALAAGAVNAAPVQHDYRIEVAPDLTEMRVQARFAVPVHRMNARDREAADFLRHAEDCATGDPLTTRGRRLSLPDAGVRCVDYVVDLGKAAQRERRNRYLTDANVAASPAKWLWRPRVDETTEIRVHFTLPDGVRVGVPWKPLNEPGTRFLVQASPESASAPAVIGRFDYHEVSVAGSVLRVALPDAEPAVDQESVLRWLRATATDVSLTYGRFPNPSPFVIVLPIASERRWSNSAVPFGRVIRDGGEAVELFVDQTRPLADYLSDWTATHEFSHLMVPYLNSQARWISEGFAQYYQNVLLARSGAYEQEMAWHKIVSGLRRGASSQPSLSPNEAAMRGRRGARMKVYWSGAALALMADVELRTRSGGRESLDTVLDDLQACCLPSDKVWSGADFFAQLDTLLDEPVFMPLYERYADAAGFPDPNQALSRLGVRPGPAGVVLDDGAELADVRNAIMLRDAKVAAWRKSLTSATTD